MPNDIVDLEAMWSYTFPQPNTRRFKVKVINWEILRIIIKKRD